MSALRELQQDFAVAVLHHAVPSLLPHLRGPQPEARALLYANTIYGTLTKALEALYPVIARLVGGRCFDGLARRFIRQVPSRSGDLHQFGGEFADFIASTPLREDLPYLPDVARLEWVVHRVFHASDAVALDLNRLRDVAPERYADLHFVSAPASALLSSAYPVHRIWQANQPGADGSVARDSEPARLLVLRGPVAIEMLSPSPGEFALLSALRAGSTIGAAVAAALEVDAGFDPQSALAAHIARGVWADFWLPPDAPLSGIASSSDP
jgi:hypothetical protein